MKAKTNPLTRAVEAWNLRSAKERGDAIAEICDRLIRHEREAVFLPGAPYGCTHARAAEVLSEAIKVLRAASAPVAKKGRRNG